MYQLKRAGVHQDDLVRIYVSVIRPILKYACPAWSTNIPQYLSDYIELVQKRALKSIFPGQHYTDILTNVKMPSLAERRVQLCKDYFDNMKKDNHKLNHLLPCSKETPYALRNQYKLPLPKIHTDRFKKSFIPWCLYNYQ